MNLKKKIAIGIVLFITHIGFYVTGSITNRSHMLHLIKHDFRKINTTVNLGRYIGYKEIAIAIKADNFEKSLCIAELGASVMFDDLRSCITSEDCSKDLKDQINKDVPEISGDLPLPFKYIEEKYGKRSCS